MKRFYILITFVFFTVAAKAQFGVAAGGTTITGRISGTVIDSLTKKPVDYATVSLYRSGGKSPVTGVVTDNDGDFKLDNIKPGKYRLSISFIGYTTRNVEPVVTTDSKPDNKVGKIYVSPLVHNLGGVSIVGQGPLIESKIDKIVYNAEKDLTSAGGNATDVLQKVPLVNVDINGNVSIRGDGNVKVLINGKPSGATSASLSDVLKTIPADQIKSIEVVTSPSAKYDAEGSGGIINIITKQKNISGFSGSVSGGVGTRQNNGNINLNYNKNRFSLGINAGGNLTWPQTTTTVFDQNINNNAIINHNDLSSRTKRHGAIGSVTAGYEFNAFNSLNTTFRLNDGGFNTEGGGTYTQKGDSVPPLPSYKGSTLSHNHFGGFDWNMDYTHKFKKEGHEITVSGQWSHSIITTDSKSLFDKINPSQTGDNNGKNNEYTLQADYTLPASKLLKIEAGGKTIQRRISSVYDVFNTDTLGNNPVRNIPNSGLYNYNQNVYAGYTVLTFTLPKNYSLLAGGRIEETRIKGDPQNPYQDPTDPNYQELHPFTSNYTTYIPSLTIQKQFSAGKTLKLSYSKRIQRPSLTYLNPYRNTSNPQSQTQGDPKLSPETSQTIELGYNAIIRSSVLNFSVYYKKTDNMIEQLVKPDSLTNDAGTIGTYANIGKNRSFGASFFGAINPIKPLTIRSSINVFTYSPIPINVDSANAPKTGTYVQYSLFGSASYQFSHNIVAEAFGFINSPRRTIQGTSPSFGMYAFGIKKQFDNKRASIGINAVQPFARDKYFKQDIKSDKLTQSFSSAFPFRSFGITFSYSFGKLTFSNPQQPKKGINNDDMKQGDQSGGMGGSATGAPAGGGR